MHLNLVPVIAAMVGVAVLQWIVTGKKGSEADVKELIASHPDAKAHFIALEYCYGILNRTYVVFVTEGKLCGAKARGILPAPVAVTERWRNPYFYPDLRRLRAYSGVRLESEEFRRMNRANFQIDGHSIRSVAFSSEPKWGMGAVPYSGRLFVTLDSGTTRELILLGTQDAGRLVDSIKSMAASHVAA